MLVQFDLVGVANSVSVPTVELPSVLNVGDVVDIPDVSQADSIVRTVVLYPYEEPTPMVYVVLGPRRPE